MVRQSTYISHDIVRCEETTRNDLSHWQIFPCMLHNMAVIKSLLTNSHLIVRTAECGRPPERMVSKVNQSQTSTPTGPVPPSEFSPSLARGADDLVV